MDDNENRGIKRIRQACQNCRRKKTRCSGERPICSFCARLGQECRYDPSDDYRNGHNNSQPDTDELAARIAMLESRLVQMGSGQPFSSTEANGRGSVNGRSDYSNSYAVDTSDEGAYSNAQHRFGAMPPPTARRRTASVVGPELLKEAKRPSQPNLVCIEVGDKQKSPTSAQLPASPPAAIAGWPVPLSTQLIAADVYFEHAHNQPYCYFAEKPFRRRLADGLVPPHLVFALLATAARFSDDSSLRGTEYDMTDVYAKAAWSDILARSLATDDALAVHLVQTTNLLAAADFTGGRMRQAWIKVGLAVRFAQELHMMMEPDPAMTPVEREEWRRVFWSVYLLDRLVSCGRHRPMVFRDEDCQIALPSTELAFRAGRVEPQWTLQQVLDGTQLPDSFRPDYFCLTILVASCVGRAARYMLHQRGNDQYPPWNSKSDFASTSSALLTVETYIFTEHITIAEWVRRKLVVNGTIDQQRAGHFLFSRMLFHLGHILLNHPFLMRERLKGLNRPTPQSFLREALRRCQTHAEALTTTIEESRAAGCLAEASFYAYATIVAGGVHCLYMHDADPNIRTRSTALLRSSFNFMKTNGETWKHYLRIMEILTNILGTAKSASWLIYSDTDNSGLDDPSFDNALWWHALDYSALCDVKRSASASPESSGSALETHIQEEQADAQPLTQQQSNTDQQSLQTMDNPEPASAIDPNQDPTLASFSPGRDFDWTAFMNSQGAEHDPTQPSAPTDMMWDFMLEENNEVPSAPMGYGSPFWKNLTPSQHV